MDTSEATTIVMSRIQSLDRENASKIMGYILIQDQGEKEIIRLAFSPDTLLLSYINQAKLHLGLSSSPPPFPLNPSPPILIPNNGAFPFRPRPVSYPDDPILSPTDPLLFPYAEDGPSFHDEPNHGFVWRPCMYYARGFCKNGSSCRFLHLDADPFDVSDQLLKLKQRSEFSSSSRQIYLTFPADSMFNEEDVSNYFSMFGQVQDVRIPYQQRRMFGFVTFVHPETVKAILDKGNPHFVCESRVLVKPYKEKGKIREKKQHLERGDYSACLSPSAIDSMEHYDHPYGPRMLLSPQEMMLREKLEREAELLNAIEFQGQRMMRLQLRNQNHNHQYLQTFPFSSPRSSRFLMDQNGTTSFPSINVEDSEESDGGQETAVMADEKLMLEGVESTSHLHGRLEHVLPDNLFSFPSKPGAKNESVFNRASVENTFSNNTPTLPHPNTSL